MDKNFDEKSMFDQNNENESIISYNIERNIMDSEQVTPKGISNLN